MARSTTGPALLVALMLATVPASAVAAPTGTQAATATDEVRIPTAEAWSWPVALPFRLERPFQAPAHAYGPGHRGIDVLPVGATTVRAPADGIVAFTGSIANRGVMTIDHGDGLVSTLEPVDPVVEVGSIVGRGEIVGELAVGGHAMPGRLHFGVRRHGDYINPLLLLGGVPRAVLLPCC